MAAVPTLCARPGLGREAVWAYPRTRGPETPHEGVADFFGHANVRMLGSGRCFKAGASGTQFPMP